MPVGVKRQWGRGNGLPRAEPGSIDPSGQIPGATVEYTPSEFKLNLKQAVGYGVFCNTESRANLLPTTLGRPDLKQEVR